MFSSLFYELKSAKVPVTLKEYLTLIEAVDADLAGGRVEDFYYLARAALIKDERHLDTFDRVFGHVFKGLDLMSETTTVEIPAEWLKLVSELHLSEEEKALIEAVAAQEGLPATHVAVFNGSSDPLNRAVFAYTSAERPLVQAPPFRRATAARRSSAAGSRSRSHDRSVDLSPGSLRAATGNHRCARGGSTRPARPVP